MTLSDAVNAERSNETNFKMIIYINYALLVQFSLLSIGWLFVGDKLQALYWCGAFMCTAGVTFK